MTLAEEIAADTLAAIDAIGDAITYHVSGGSDLSINGVPLAMPPSRRDSDDRRVTSHRVLIAVAKSDVTTPQINQDTVTVPGSWVNQSTSQTLRVGAVHGDRSDPGHWLIELV